MSTTRLPLGELIPNKLPTTITAHQKKTNSNDYKKNISIDNTTNNNNDNNNDNTNKNNLTLFSAPPGRIPTNQFYKPPPQALKSEIVKTDSSLSITGAGSQRLAAEIADGSTTVVRPTSSPTKAPVTTLPTIAKQCIITTPQHQVHARRLRNRLRLAHYKVLTNQEMIPLIGLTARRQVKGWKPTRSGSSSSSSCSSSQLSLSTSPDLPCSSTSPSTQATTPKKAMPICLLYDGKRTPTSMKAAKSLLQLGSI